MLAEYPWRCISSSLRFCSGNVDFYSGGKGGNFLLKQIPLEDEIEDSALFLIDLHNGFRQRVVLRGGTRSAAYGAWP